MDIFVGTAAIISLYAILHFWQRSRTRKYLATRPNFTQVQFVAHFPAHQEGAQAAYAFLSDYMPKGMAPHPDDKLVTNLGIDGEDISEWVYDRWGITTSQQLSAAEIEQFEQLQTAADLVRAANRYG